jgi:hypothetical protein
MKIYIEEYIYVYIPVHMHMIIHMYVDKISICMHINTLCDKNAAAIQSP